MFAISFSFASNHFHSCGKETKKKKRNEENGLTKVRTIVICFFHWRFSTLKTALPKLGPASQPRAEKPSTIRPSVMKGSRGTWVRTGSAAPVLRKTAPPAPLATMATALNATCQRRRALRSLKKVFQSRRWVPSGVTPGDGVVEAQRRKRRRARVVVVVDGVAEVDLETGEEEVGRKQDSGLELASMLIWCDWVLKGAQVVASGQLGWVLLLRGVRSAARGVPWPASRNAIVVVVGDSMLKGGG